MKFRERLANLKAIYFRSSRPEHSGHAEIVAYGSDDNRLPWYVVKANSRTVGEINNGVTMPGEVYQVATHFDYQTWLIHYEYFDLDFNQDEIPDTV